MPMGSNSIGGVPDHIRSINVKQNNNFSSRRLSTQNISVINSSSSSSSSTEVYYGRASTSVGVPFMWESQPGTPKVKFYQTPLPPLTPPPSFLFKSMRKPINKNPSKPNPLSSLLPKLNLIRKITRAHAPPPSPSSSISSSPQSSSRSVPSSDPFFTPSYGRGQAKEESSRWTYEEGDECESPVSTLCFGSCGGSSNIIKVLLR